MATEAATAPERPKITSKYLKDVTEMAARLTKAKGWGLCNFAAKLGCHRRASELETMVDQTVRAAAVNLKSNGLPFSFRSDGVFASGGGGLIDNGTAYGFLVSNGWVVEEELPNAEVKAPPTNMELPASGKWTVIFPAQKLLEQVRAHFMVEDNK